MSGINALEELRELIKIRMDGWLKIDTQKIADEIEEEITERFMELPVDADGVPIHVGDFLESSEHKGKKFPCRGLNVEVSDGGKRWTVCMSYDPYSGTSEYMSANRCRHVKPRTLENVLDDFQAETIQIFGKRAAGDIDSEMLRTEYADSVSACAAEIRELMGATE